MVTSEFGYRSDPFTGETRGHTGIDLAVPTGTPIRAALPGTVTVSQYNSSYGYYVIIDHGNGLSTLYGHNSRLLAQVGQTVEAGDIISLSGSTGRSTGPHLHLKCGSMGSVPIPAIIYRRLEDDILRLKLQLPAKAGRFHIFECEAVRLVTLPDEEFQDF